MDISVLYEINAISVIVRMSLAVLFGGIIGLERGAHKHAAGFRTHILVCVGAALAMMTSQFIMENISATTDPARLGAQVISGIGFLGVGTIIVTGRNKVKGLTTAAGLWASACVGLAIGIGFYLGAVVAGLMIIITLIILHKVEFFFYERSSIISIYVELDSLDKLNGLTDFFKKKDVQILDMHVNKATPVNESAVGIHLDLKTPKKGMAVEIVSEVTQQSGICFIEEL